jgi:hypothetical protein
MPDDDDKFSIDDPESFFKAPAANTNPHASHFGMLQPNPHTLTRKVERYSFSLTGRPTGSGEFEDENAPSVIMRPERTTAMVSREGQVILETLSVDGENQLMAPLDCYRISAALDAKMREEFLREHGLTGTNYKTIDDYLDLHELSIPTCTRLPLPKIGPGKVVRMSGKILDREMAMFILVIMGPSSTHG